MYVQFIHIRMYTYTNVHYNVLYSALKEERRTTCATGHLRRRGIKTECVLLL